MAFIDRATRFVDGGNGNELMLLLADCVAARNTEGMLAVQLLSRDMYGDITFNWELKAPAAYCLLAWGQAGLDALVDNALKNPTSKNFSLAFQMLAGVAEGYVPRSISSWLPDCQIRKAVLCAVDDWTNLAMVSRSLLNKLMLSIEEDRDAAAYAGTSLMNLTFQDIEAVKHLSHALALRSIAVGPRILAAYDELLAGKGDDESISHRFFESHPLLLDPRAFQVWGKPDLHGRLEPDFIIRTYENIYVVVEIETPAKLLVTRQGQLSAQATHAIGQVLQYQDYLRSHPSQASEIFPEFSTASGLVIVGRESSLDAGQKARATVGESKQTLCQNRWV